MIEPSTRYATLEETREQMAPPVLAGMTVDQFLERIRNGNQARMMTPPVEEAILANFAVLEDGTIVLSSAERTTYESLSFVGPPPSPVVPTGGVSGAAPTRPAARQSGSGGEVAAKGIQRRGCGRVIPRSKVVWLETASTTFPCNGRSWWPW